MKMGKIAKPQKSKRHKKIKAVDPFYEGNRTSDKKALTANECPKNVDTQEIPHSTREIMHLQKQAKMGKKGKKKVFPKMERGMTRPLEEVPKFKKKKTETEKAFLRRIEVETTSVLNKSKMEDEYKMKVDMAEDGTVKAKSKGKKKQKERQRLQEKKVKKKEKAVARKEDRRGDFSHLKDTVAFGEVAMAPPSLKAKPRKAESTDRRPGKKSLLLTGMMDQGSKERKVGEVQKKKDMSMAQQRRMEEERTRAVDLYRKMKAQQLANR